MNKIYSVSTDMFRKSCEISSQQIIGKDKGRVILVLFIVSMLLGAAIPTQAQTANKQETTKSSPGYLSAKEGTYQLIFNSRRHDKEIVLDAHELMVIEKLRKDNEVVYAAATYSDDIRVKILPRSVVNSPSFKPVPKKYYKEEEDYEEYHNIRYIALQ